MGSFDSGEPDRRPLRSGDPGRVGAADGRAGYDTDAVWTLPNLLSFLRLLGVPAFLTLILLHRDWAAVGVLALASLTDFLDGRLARSMHQVSRLGQMLDPIADRLYIGATVIALAVRGIIPWWFLILLLGRDLVLLCLVPALRRAGYTSLPVNFIGKAGTFCLLCAFPLVLLGSGQWPGAPLLRIIGWAFAIWGLFLYWWSGILYVQQTHALVTSRQAPV